MGSSKFQGVDLVLGVPIDELDQGLWSVFLVDDFSNQIPSFRRDRSRAVLQSVFQVSVEPLAMLRCKPGAEIDAFTRLPR